jgi:hypothetical protein
VHDVGIILAHENESGAPHVGRQLIDLVKTAVDYMATEVRIAEVSYEEIVSLTLCVLMVLEIRATNPESLRLQALD